MPSCASRRKKKIPHNVPMFRGTKCLNSPTKTQLKKAKKKAIRKNHVEKVETTVTVDTKAISTFSVMIKLGTRRFNAIIDPTRYISCVGEKVINYLMDIGIEPNEIPDAEEGQSLGYRLPATIDRQNFIFNAYVNETTQPDIRFGLEGLSAAGMIIDYADEKRWYKNAPNIKYKFKNVDHHLKMLFESYITCCPEELDEERVIGTHEDDVVKSEKNIFSKKSDVDEEDSYLDENSIFKKKKEKIEISEEKNIDNPSGDDSVGGKLGEQLEEGKIDESEKPEDVAGDEDLRQQLLLDKQLDECEEILSAEERSRRRRRKRKSSRNSQTMAFVDDQPNIKFPKVDKQEKKKKKKKGNRQWLTEAESLDVIMKSVPKDYAIPWG
uniref:Uncharacterized protein n=1 Tax=Bracon brevicornis TaxID=1563983 RepID=A0A6V7JJD0_9HYME